ncbi:hypothetical protein EDI_095670 [Entamoeba dispar SAW760]|uniref:Uncharacterized protein n=1 Tax=Entamoeba dispar (strain ATCC PRA-260 / SAW760) TaxID=370354 RepID=B0E7J8_ENTDS|nr:uncharacterized protein EDI_095670 [Entamoeba dispar SAW760]EDR29500.1 hypothetical protein EDI_095670 [Entamoeba dispar SAW760]|eukprot:EDR29500.1 hypothetical protein EDI_095670 [Entamoeba dispar SAW760]
MEEINIENIEKIISAKIKDILKKYYSVNESWESLVDELDKEKAINKKLKISILNNTKTIEEKDSQIKKLKDAIETETLKKEKEQNKVNRKPRETTVQELVLSQKAQKQNIESKVNIVPSSDITDFLNNTFYSRLIFNLYYEDRQIDVGGIIWATLSNSLILFETEELKYFGIFMSQSFLFIKESSIEIVQPKTFNYSNIYLNQEQPFLSIENYFYLFKEQIIINDIENYVNPSFKQLIRSWMTNQIGTQQTTIKIRRVFAWNIIQLIQ